MKRVLVADDTKNIRTLLCKCLELEGYTPAEAADGQQALALLQEQSFDLAFLDIKMPGMSGTEVLKAIRAAGVGTPVIIITAYATVKNAVECTQLGAVAYLHKPFTADKIRNVLAEMKETSGLAAIGRLLGQGRAQDALPLLRKALAERPLDAQVFLLLAKASELLGQADEARKYRSIYELLKQQ